jgi:hypothetical protein
MYVIQIWSIIHQQTLSDLICPTLEAKQETTKKTSQQPRTPCRNQGHAQGHGRKLRTPSHAQGQGHGRKLRTPSHAQGQGHGRKLRTPPHAHAQGHDQGRKLRISRN